MATVAVEATGNHPDPVNGSLGAFTVVLVGNPNTGKSTLFGALSGRIQRTGNYPGVTVDKKLGRYQHQDRDWVLVDLPGVYSLAPRSLDEMVTVDLLLGRSPNLPAPDVIVCVVAADNLERNLYLVSQILELGRPVVLAVTMVDVAADRGLELDLEQLQSRLALPVVPIQAHRQTGLDELKAAIARAAGPVGHQQTAIRSPLPEAFQGEIDRLAGLLTPTSQSKPPLPRGEDEPPPLWPRYLIERLLLDVGGYVEKHLPVGTSREELLRELTEARARLRTAGFAVPEVETASRFEWASAVSRDVVQHPEVSGTTRTERIDAVLTHPWLGTVVLVAIMGLMFTAVFKWSEIPMGWIEHTIELAGTWVGSHLPDGALRSLIEQGVFAGVGGILVFLPQIFVLFFFIGLLEECGYLARAAFLMDRQMVPLGLSGKSFIPLLSSFACAVPGIMATRVIEDRRSRFTTIMVAPLMSCSARMPVYALLVWTFIPDLWYAGGLLSLRVLVIMSLYGLGILVAVVVALVVRWAGRHQGREPFVMELPSYQWPSLRVVFWRMLQQGGEFIYRAGTLILAVSIMMWAFLYYPRLEPTVVAPYESELAALEWAANRASEQGQSEELERLQAASRHTANELDGLQKRQSYLGRMGRAIEPVVEPLGWDWRIGSAVIASFPAREIVVSTLGVIFDQGEAAAEDDPGLQAALQKATNVGTGQPLFTLPVALSVLVFFCLCAQCAATLAVIGSETGHWRWPLICFAYMTTLAYVGALAAYQGAQALGF